MKTTRAILTTALSKWIEDKAFGELRFCRLVHFTERPNPITIDRFELEGVTNVAELADRVEQAAKNDAENAGGGIRETYGLLPYFGTEIAEGAICRFSVNAAPADAVGEDGMGGGFTEGANPRGQVHQGMRHLEAMGRTYTEAISRLFERTDAVFERLERMNQHILLQNERLMLRNGEMSIAVEEARDRSTERNLAVYRLVQEEERTTKIIDGLIPAAMMLANAATGMPIFTSTEDSTAIAAKSWIRSLDEGDMELMSRMNPAKYMYVRAAKDQIMKEDEESERRREEKSKQVVSGVVHTDQAKAVLVKRDDQGIARPAL